MQKCTLTAAALGVAMSVAAHAQSTDADRLLDTVRQVTTHLGEMVVSVEATDVTVEDTLRFEPYQQFEEMFFRDDVVYLMRHGPTDWSKLDEKNVAPTDCENQRVMSNAGKASMRDLGALLASNEVLPSQVVVSEWCRNQQTVEHLFEGFDRIDPAIAAEMPVETDSNTNLLLSLQGAKDTASLRERISSWDGHPERSGPLLIVTHYTNIEELTQFRVLEGEILVLDPKRDNQVLGYLRLASAVPDVGHFADVLSSPLLERSEALDMVMRYYEALATNDAAAFRETVSDRWVSDWISPSLGVDDVEGFLEAVSDITDGLEDAEFVVDDVHVTEDVVTVLGTVYGEHTGDIYGIAATGKTVSFGAIAVHRIADGKITESWQMSDRLSLLQQIAE
ncbi:MAG: ester cyclase [Pseudomonadota bacterium]